MINSRSLQDLNPQVRRLTERFIEECKAANIDVIITSTYRDNESQSALYAIGRTVKGADVIPVIRPMGRTVTKARAGQSFHNYKCAFDFCPVVNGKAQWNDAKLFARCGEIAEKVGLEWAGRWKSFSEAAHCQYTGGLTLADLQAGKVYA